MGLFALGVLLGVGLSAVTGFSVVLAVVYGVVLGTIAVYVVARAVAGATQGVMPVATSRPQNQTLKARGSDQGDHQDQ